MCVMTIVFVPTWIRVDQATCHTNFMELGKCEWCCIEQVTFTLLAICYSKYPLQHTFIDCSQWLGHSFSEFFLKDGCLAEVARKYAPTVPTCLPITSHTCTRCVCKLNDAHSTIGTVHMLRTVIVFISWKLNVALLTYFLVGIFIRLCLLMLEAWWVRFYLAASRAEHAMACV